MKTDYSSQAVTRRLKVLDDLRRTCLLLAGSRLKWTWAKTSGSVSGLAVQKKQTHKWRRDE